MAAAAAVKALALHKYFINTLQVPVTVTTAFMAEDDLADSTDRIIEDTKAEEANNQALPQDVSPSSRWRCSCRSTWAMRRRSWW
jgi:hypothetical protein